jgi:hypothetical protein
MASETPPRRFPYDEISFDPHFCFTLVTLPHVYRFLKACHSPASVLAPIAAQEAAFFCTLRRMIARRLRNEDYAVIIEHLWAGIANVAADPAKAYHAVGDIAAALYHYLNLNFKRTRGFFTVAVEMLPGDHRAKDLLARIESQYANQFGLIQQAVAAPQLSDIRPADSVDELEFLRYSPAGRRLWTLGVTAPEAFAVCRVCRGRPAMTFAFPCCCGLTCHACQVSLDTRTCPACGKPVTGFGKTLA